MAVARLNTKLINTLRDILLRLHYGEVMEDVQTDFKRSFQGVDAVEILLIIYDLLNSDDGITHRDVKKFFAMYVDLYGYSITDIDVPAKQSNHPVNIFQAENKALQDALPPIDNLLNMLEENPQYLHDENVVERLKEKIAQIGQFINHYNRKEKIYFPILERYGYFALTRTMWADDDRIRNLYKGTKSMLEKIPQLDFKYIKQSYELFKRQFKAMIFQEETFLLPVAFAYFKEEDWLAIQRESDAFGYALIEPEEELKERQKYTSRMLDEHFEAKQIPFGGGFLTLKEADHILNNLPVEITFVDKYGVFKYFNDKVKASDMMFVRTPSSIGRNVINCHPPKSMKKVKRLIHDLQTKRRTHECMWFKKDGRYVHITYKALFAEDGEYLGILEYVQDIRPFLNLPREVKKELRPLD